MTNIFVWVSLAVISIDVLIIIALYSLLLYSIKVTKKIKNQERNINDIDKNL